MRAVSDSGPTASGMPKSQAVENLFTLLQAVSSAETLQYFNEQYDQCTIRYGDLKKQLAEDLVNFTAPIYDRILSLKTNDDYLRKVL